MATLAPSLEFHPRRAHARLRLRIPARLMTLNGPRDVVLLDLSQSGARVEMAGRERITGGVLSWIGYEAFGVRVWQSGQIIGLKFERPINSGCVIATRNWKPCNRAAKIESRDFARKWAKGTADKSAALYSDDGVPRTPALDMTYLRGRKSGWRQSGPAFILGASLIGVAAGICSCFF